MPIARAVARSVACLLALNLVLIPAQARAAAEDAEAVAKVTKMNKKAVEEYENLNFEEARRLLKEALDVCSASGLDKHPIKARTHIHLGVVILAGFKQRELGIKQFQKALEIQPDIKLTKSLANPEIQAAFDEAAAGGGGAGEKTEGGPAADKGPEGLVHTPVTAGIQGNTVAVTATVGPELAADKVVLAYRPEGATDFLARDMRQVAPNSYSADIPATATEGGTVDYYIEAQKEGQPVASRGSLSSPLTVTLSPPRADGEGEEGEDEGEEEEEDEEERRFFIGLMVGSGVGWATGFGEVNARHELKPPGFALARLGHLAPEVGYFVSPQLMVSLQGRFQLVSGATVFRDMPMTGAMSECGSDMTCTPAQSAAAVLGKGSWFFGEGKLRPHVSMAIGGGYIRHVVKFVSLTDCGQMRNTTCVDTIAAGAFLVGPGAGIVYSVSPVFALVAGANTLFGLPKFTFNIDVQVGGAVTF
jgi:hypothetical protein